MTERLRSNLGSSTQVDTLKRGTSCKAGCGNFFERRRQGNLNEGVAIVKRIDTKRRKRRAKLNGRQGIAICKRKLANRGDAIGNFDTPQANATVKRAHADAFNPLGQGDLLERLALEESIISKRFASVREGDFCKILWVKAAGELHLRRPENVSKVGVFVEITALLTAKY